MPLDSNEGSPSSRRKQRNWPRHRQALREGGRVCLYYRPPASRIGQGAAEIGSNVTAVKGDVANPNDLDRLYRRLYKRSRPRRARRISCLRMPELLTR